MSEEDKDIADGTAKMKNFFLVFFAWIGVVVNSTIKMILALGLVLLGLSIAALSWHLIHSYAFVFEVLPKIQ